MNDKLLETGMPSGVQLIAFTDNVVTVIGMAKTGPELETVVNQALGTVTRWMSEHGLQLAHQKTEAVVLTTKKVYANPRLHMEGHDVPIKDSIRYLDVELDTKLSFTKHVAQVSKKATGMARAFGQLMPNVGDPSPAKRALLATVINS